MRSLEQEIHQWIWENCYDKELKTFVQYAGAKHQDATNFLFVILHFLDKKDPRTREILEATNKRTGSEIKSFVYRYLAEDGLQGEEGVLFCVPFGLSPHGLDLKKWIMLLNFSKNLKIYCTSWTHCRRS